MKQWFDVNNHLSDNDFLQNYGKKLEESFLNGVPFQKHLGYSDDLLALKFEAGQDYYRNREYSKAKDIFAYLVLLNPYVKKYWHCLAAAQVHLHMDEQALQTYVAAALLDPKDPMSHLCSAYCYLRQGDVAAAESSVHISLQLSQKNPCYKELEQTSLDVLHQIKKQRGNQ